MITLTTLSDKKKTNIDLSKTESIEEYQSGSKIRTIVSENKIIKDFWVEESPEQICEIANSKFKKHNHSVTIYWKK
jgi:hypothetical protein